MFETEEARAMGRFGAMILALDARGIEIIIRENELTECISGIQIRATIVGHSIPIRPTPRDFAVARISASSVASGRLRRWASSR